MEKLALSLHVVHKALATLHKAIIYLKKVEINTETDAIESASDSVIKRFEYSYDSFWKALKKYLEIRYNLEDVNSPKSVFRACVKYEICTPEQGELLLTIG